MEKTFLIIVLFSLIALSNSATIVDVNDLFDGLYKGVIKAGYLKTKREGDELFYLYLPTQNGDPNAPVMLWLNGGPGCSSLYGLLAEIGPVTEENFANKFELNPYSWNKEVNLLVIEQPAGIGFSKASNPWYEWDDDTMAENLLVGIKDFLSTHNLTEKEFYVSGESYAGVYIPYLTKHILNDDSDDKVNLKGILIGNGLTDFDVDVERSIPEFAFWHGLLSPKTFKLYKKYCEHQPDELNPQENTNNKLNDGYVPRNVTKKCNEIREIIAKELDGSDLYGIYRECPRTETISPNHPLYYNSQNTYKKTIIKRLKQIKSKKLTEELEPENDLFPPFCDDDLFFDEFLNQETIKDKLQVDQSINWSQCKAINYTLGTSLDFYNKTLVEHPELRVWFFSGTEDAILSTIGSLRWINKLNFTVEKKWKQYYLDKQVCGYDQKYKEGLVIVTIKGAGHMAPQDQRASSYKMYSSFIKGILPSENE